MIEKRKIENINNKYEFNIEYIDNFNIDTNLKKRLHEINNALYNLSTKGLNISNIVSIYIENISQDTIDLIIDLLIKLLKDYELYEKNPTFLEKAYHSFSKNELIIIRDYNLFSERHEIEKVKKEVLIHNSFLIVAREDKYSDDYFTPLDFNSRITFRIIGKDYTEEEILNNLKNKLKENNIKHNIIDKDWLEIITTALTNNECYRCNCTEYLFKKIIQLKILNNLDTIDKSSFNLPKNVNSVTIKLDDLIGLDNVKKEISSLKNYLAMQKRIGKGIQNNYLNMMFLGNPGTGKTTIGKIYANILYELGFIKENKLIEITPNDLMANYVGQTKDQTRKILDKAKGGVLFIDEAYLMSNVTYSDGFSSYMSEAIVELMKYMENPENVIIFAGYPLETRKIYDSNPGMKSRICKEIIFEDYNTEELYTILKNNLKKIGFKISKKGETKIKNKIKQESQKKNFGNARFCHVLMQQILMNYANRNINSDTYLIIEEDIKFDKDTNFGIGFMEA